MHNRMEDTIIFR